jgi:diguanylate cyclase (GGDEF)-like protein/PAS domain S-box-containing protein
MYSTGHPRGEPDFSEYWLRAVLENTSDVICVLGKDGTFLYVSPAIEGVLGYPPRELLGTVGFDYVHAEDAAFVAMSFAEIARTPGVHAPVEFRARAADGSLRYVQAILNNRLGDPVLGGVVVTFRDLTERTHAEEEIRFHARLLDAVGQAVVAIDPGGRVVYWNKTAEESLGWSAGDVRGRSVLEAALPEQTLNQREEIMFWLRDGRSWSAEFELRRRDGSHFPAIVTTTPVLDERGELVCIIGVSTDITDRKQAERALRRSRRRFRSLVRNSSDVITILDENGTVRYESPATEQITGYAPEERLGRHGFELIHPEDRERLRRVHAEVRNEPGARRSAEIRSRHKDGSWRHLEAVVHNLLGDPSVRGLVVNARDVTERKDAEDRLREAEQRYRTLVEQIPAIIYVDEAGESSRTTYVSPQNEAILGYHPEEILKDPDHWVKTMHPDDRERVLAEARRTDETGKPFRTEYRQISRGGRVVWLRDEADLVRDEAGKPLYWLGVQTDVTERKAMEGELRRLAFHDRLTGLPNRQLFMDRLGQALERTRRKKNIKIGVLFMDMNGFKDINDSLGHEVGDLLLVVAAQRLQRCLRPEDTLSRFGGDEFIVLLEGIGDPDEAARVAERITEELKKPFAVEGRELFVSISIGIAMGDVREKLPETLLRDADIAMYRAKERGSGYEFFAPAMYEGAVARLNLQNDLRRAVELGQFVLHYQPMTSLRTGNVTGLEALVRWRHPERGLLAPLEFIPISEEIGTIVPLGLWVLKEACRQAKEWQHRYPKSPPLSMSVNLSARQLQDPGIVAQVADTLEEVGLDPSTLILEITESGLAGHPVDTADRLRELKDLGVGLAVDDFGTGYSSLSYLKHLPIDRLKIDRTFVGDLSTDHANTSIVMATVTLGHALGIEVVVEGVETADEYDAVRTLDCDIGQGYYWSVPHSAEEAEVLLASDLPPAARSVL